ncbi:hypothetical protein KQ945_05695 [Bacillus subtilis subsp. subtilis]|nr:hypothetical protein [Bacillus subtilis subsp. subtilis]
MRRIRCLLFLALTCAAAPLLAADCTVANRDAVLALPLQVFDGDRDDGWRALVQRPGCTLETAELIADYRGRQPAATGDLPLIWREAHLRALSGQRDPASALMRQTYKPAQADMGGWNAYVDATIAFLDDDLPALQQARARLAALPPPPGRVVRDGKLQVGAEQVPWPPRLSVVDALVRCMYQPYALAYEACPTSSPY